MRNVGFCFVLKRRWFDLFTSGVKKAEYREITPYWLQRLFSEKRSGLYYALNKEKAAEWCCDINKLKEAIREGRLCPTYKVATFYHGYATDRERFERVVERIDIGTVNPAWAPEGTPAEKEFFRVWIKTE